jgi:5'-nucleotidase
LRFDDHGNVTTAAMESPTSFAAKYKWIKEHFPFFPDSHIAFCGDKSTIAADFLIDDNTHDFARFSEQGLLFSASHNLFETRSRRLDSWQDIGSRFL